MNARLRTRRVAGVLLMSGYYHPSIAMSPNVQA